MTAIESNQVVQTVKQLMLHQKVLGLAIFLSRTYSDVIGTLSPVTCAQNFQIIPKTKFRELSPTCKVIKFMHYKHYSVRCTKVWLG